MARYGPPKYRFFSLCGWRCVGGGGKPSHLLDFHRAIGIQWLSHAPLNIRYYLCVCRSVWRGSIYALGRSKIPPPHTVPLSAWVCVSLCVHLHAIIMKMRSDWIKIKHCCSVNKICDVYSPTQSLAHTHWHTNQYTHIKRNDQTD